MTRTIGAGGDDDGGPIDPSDLCTMCEQQRAVLWCRECSVGLCTSAGCDGELHADPLSWHHRTDYKHRHTLPSSHSLCDICHNHDAAVYCHDCQSLLCVSGGCDSELHSAESGGDFISHHRTKVTGERLTEKSSPQTGSLPVLASNSSSSSDSDSESEDEKPPVEPTIASVTKVIAAEKPNVQPEPVTMPLPIPLTVPVADIPVTAVSISPISAATSFEPVIETMLPKFTTTESPVSLSARTPPVTAASGSSSSESESDSESESEDDRAPAATTPIAKNISVHQRASSQLPVQLAASAMQRLQLVEDITESKPKRKKRHTKRDIEPASHSRVLEFRRRALAAMQATLTEIRRQRTAERETAEREFARRDTELRQRAAKLSEEERAQRNKWLLFRAKADKIIQERESKHRQKMAGVEAKDKQRRKEIRTQRKMIREQQRREEAERTEKLLVAARGVAHRELEARESETAELERMRLSAEVNEEQNNRAQHREWAAARRETREARDRARAALEAGLTQAIAIRREQRLAEWESKQRDEEVKEIAIKIRLEEQRRAQREVKQQLVALEQQLEEQRRAAAVATLVASQSRARHSHIRAKPPTRSSRSTLSVPQSSVGDSSRRSYRSERSSASPSRLVSYRSSASASPLPSPSPSTTTSALPSSHHPRRDDQRHNRQQPRDRPAVRVPPLQLQRLTMKPTAPHYPRHIHRLSERSSVSQSTVSESVRSAFSIAATSSRFTVGHSNDISSPALSSTVSSSSSSTSLSTRSSRSSSRRPSCSESPPDSARSAQSNISFVVHLADKKADSDDAGTFRSSDTARSEYRVHRSQARERSHVKRSYSPRPSLSPSETRARSRLRSHSRSRSRSRSCSESRHSFESGSDCESDSEHTERSSVCSRRHYRSRSPSPRRRHQSSSDSDDSLTESELPSARSEESRITAPSMPVSELSSAQASARTNNSEDAITNRSFSPLVTPIHSHRPVRHPAKAKALVRQSAKPQAVSVRSNKLVGKPVVRKIAQATQMTEVTHTKSAANPKPSKPAATAAVPVVRPTRAILVKQQQKKAALKPATAAAAKPKTRRVVNPVLPVFAPNLDYQQIATPRQSGQHDRRATLADTNTKHTLTTASTKEYGSFDTDSWPILSVVEHSLATMSASTDTSITNSTESTARSHSADSASEADILDTIDNASASLLKREAEIDSSLAAIKTRQQLRQRSSHATSDKELKRQYQQQSVTAICSSIAQQPTHVKEQMSNPLIARCEAELTVLRTKVKIYQAHSQPQSVPFVAPALDCPPRAASYEWWPKPAEPSPFMRDYASQQRRQSNVRQVHHMLS